MKAILRGLTLLTAAVLLCAVPAVASTGPFGTSGPADYKAGDKTVVTDHGVTVRGTGPYGAIGYFGTAKGEVSKNVTLDGTGPYGAFDISGMIPSGKVLENRDCILVAKNCPTTR